ncbi:hypothetical protein GDO78_003032, partial [Eleutherodactylus coqui]
CAVSYIDYGNSEVLDRSSIVELPEELQSTPIAQKYRLWGLQLLTASDIEQGLKFLTQLVGDQQISVQQKAIYKDGTVVVQVSHNDLDIGEEVAKQGFALRSKLISSPNGALETMDVPANEIRSPYSWQIKSIERLPMREPKSLPISLSTDTNTVKSDQKCLEENAQLKEENRQLKGECMQIKEANKQIKDESMQLDEEHKLLKSENKKLLDDYRQLKEEKEILFQKSIALEQHVQKMQFQNKNERESFERNIHEMEMRLASAAGHKLKALTAKIDILKNVRRENINMTAADDLLEAVKVVGQEQLCAPSTLNILEENWKEYSCAQETIRECSDLVELDLLIEGRNKAKEQLNLSVDAFVIEVDQLPLESRLAKLQVLLNSLEDMYGASCSCEDSDVVFQEFYNWKEAKLEKFSTVRIDTDSSLGLMCTWLSDIEKYFDLKSDITFGSSDDVFDIDNLLQKVDCNVSKELEISLVKPSESDCKIIRNAYSRVVKLIYEETCLISVVKAKYLASIEFQKNISEWINKKMNVDDLINIKKSIKILKAELRWKLHVSSSMEESEEYDAAAHSEVKAEIATIRNKIFCEIQREREEYALLSDLTQKWFPELPLMYSDVGITSYMNSGGLLSGSMERMLFDAEPLKELSNKRPLVCTKVQNQKVLLKGYSVGMDTEEQVIVRASKYHKAWLQQKEESGILQLLYLFFCKFDPVVYVMVPFYPGESLGCIQANNKLTSYETMRVMRGVAHGLHTLHASNIIIGSLHENNVFAVNRERGIVGDFDFTRDEVSKSLKLQQC